MVSEDLRSTKPWTERISRPTSNCRYVFIAISQWVISSWRLCSPSECNSPASASTVPSTARISVLIFEDSRGIEPTASPVIISHAPFELRCQSITEIDVWQTDGAQDSVFANINLAGVKVEHGRRSPNQRLKTARIEILAKVLLQLLQMRREFIPASGEMSSNARIRTRRTTQVSSPNYRLAVLFTRKNYLDFQAWLHLLVHVGWRHRVENRFSGRMTVSGVNPNLTFSPAVHHYEGNCTGIDRK